MLGAGLLACVLAGCQRYWVCDEPDTDALAVLPPLLSQTGLFADMSSERLSANVLAYRPQFELWSDGAHKRRWLALPRGTRIETSDMDAWIFPKGTKLWKEFTRDGARVETRLLQKLDDADDSWIGVSYVWDADQSDATLTPYGAIDALGTPHNVPASNECMACHGGTHSGVLGFSAIQLSMPASRGEVALRELVARDLLSDPPARSFEVPGNADERAALGYLHANCSHCHNQQRPHQTGARCFDPDNELDFALSVHALATPQDTATYRSMGSVVEARHPGASRLIELVSERGMCKQMPPLATERVDEHAVALLRRWIERM